MSRQFSQTQPRRLNGGMNHNGASHSNNGGSPRGGEIEAAASKDQNLYQQLIDSSDLVKELDDIEAISQQISQHAEVLYQNWKTNSQPRPQPQVRSNFLDFFNMQQKVFGTILYFKFVLSIILKFLTSYVTHLLTHHFLSLKQIRIGHILSFFTVPFLLYVISFLSLIIHFLPIFTLYGVTQYDK